MAQNVEIFMLPVEETSPLELSSSSEKDPEKIKRAEISEKISVAGDELQDDTGLTSPRLIISIVKTKFN